MATRLVEMLSEMQMLEYVVSQIGFTSEQRWLREERCAQCAIRILSNEAASDNTNFFRHFSKWFIRRIFPRSSPAENVRKGGAPLVDVIYTRWTDTEADRRFFSDYLESVDILPVVCLDIGMGWHSECDGITHASCSNTYVKWHLVETFNY